MQTLSLALLISAGVINFHIAWQGRAGCPALHYAMAVLSFIWVLTSCETCP